MLRNSGWVEVEVEVEENTVAEYISSQTRWMPFWLMKFKRIFCVSLSIVVPNGLEGFVTMTPFILMFDSMAFLYDSSRASLVILKLSELLQFTATNSTLVLHLRSLSNLHQ